MLESIPSGRSGYLSNLGCIIWLICGLLLGGWVLFMMKYCLNSQQEDKDKYKQENKAR